MVVLLIPDTAVGEQEVDSMGITVIPISKVAKVSTLVVDTNLDLGLYALQAPSIYVDDIYEHSLGAGIGVGNPVEISDDLTVLGSLVASYTPAAPTAGNVKASYYPDAKTTTSTSFVRLMPGFMVVRSGQIRVGWEQARTSGSTGGRVQVYVNDAGVSTEQYLNSGTYTAYYRDIDVSAGDVVTLYQKADSSTTYGCRKFWIGSAGDPMGLIIRAQEPV